MNPLTKSELEEYFDSIRGSNPPEIFDDPKEHALMMEALNNRSTADFLIMIFRAASVLMDEGSAILSIFATGFQMGREYESRHQTANELERLLGRE